MKHAKGAESTPEPRHRSFQLQDEHLKNIFSFHPDYALEFLQEV